MISSEKKKVVFLYTELAEYFLSSIRKLSQVKEIEIHIIRWPVNKEAPFDFNFPENIKIYNKKDYFGKELLQLIQDISPDVLYCSGWIDKDYLHVCKNYRNKIPVIVGLDNKWKGSFKQWIAVLLSRFTILNHYSYCWVSGDLQYKYAKRLGFGKDKIFKGVYSADVDLFYNRYLSTKETKQKHFPKRFIYVGRYYAFKGIQELWQAFIELQNDNPNDWELWCLGTGDISPVIHPKIKHFGFVQPNEMAKFINETGVFVLPSHIEPWGVVVHEFAAAGYPLLCSRQVGAASTFLEDGLNGYFFDSGSNKELKSALKKIMTHSPKDLLKMGEISLEKSKNITPEKWANTLISLLPS